MSSSLSQPTYVEGSVASSTLAHSPIKCLTCDTCGTRYIPSKTPRNLVVCVDGTANKFGRNNTNVVKLLEAIDCDNKECEQIVYYSSGIGTRPRSSNWFKRMTKTAADLLNMAVAWNTREILEDAYAWLAEKYKEGDHIYLFGFSRGAYQVRVLAWMIYEVGLVKNPSEKQVGTAYDHFNAVRSRKLGASGLARQFKTTFSWNNVKVHFIGVWDTVSSVGFGRGGDCLSASSAATHACHIRHALALDEYRVKFMPEYFFEMNSPDLRSEKPDDRDDTTTSKVQPAVVSAIPSTHYSYGGHPDPKTADIKEVWFAGSHSDVGGKDRPGNAFHAGKISLMWMRHEASMSGLLLKPAWVLWTAKDINWGATNSMSFLWRLAEIFPVTHQISFRGVGKNAWRFHLFEPRRIIPGQKIHGSVRFANTYIPTATFGNGFGNPLETTRPIPSKNGDIWEKGVIEHVAYVTLFNHLIKGEGDASCYLHKLLFMLRFSESPSPVKEEPIWQGILSDLVTEKSGLVRLVAIAAYFEAMSPSDVEETFSAEVFAEATQSLHGLMKPDGLYLPRVVALMRPFAKHTKLRDSILTRDIIKAFLQLVDDVTSIQGAQEHFEDVMDALSCLIELHPGSESIIDQLAGLSGGAKDRLSPMLEIKDPHHLTAVLRVVISLAKKDPHCCCKVVDRLHMLAKKRNKPFRSLAIQALAEILRPRPDVPKKLHSFHSLRRAEPSASRVHRLPEGIKIPNTKPFRPHTEFIQNLLSIANGRHTEARTTAIFTLLKLCEDNDVRSCLSKQGLVDVLVRQLQFKDSALLVAYALTRCLSYEILSTQIGEDDHLAGYIINMIRLNYFDEAVGLVEGFDILRNLLRCDGLKNRILKYKICTLLENKLGAGKSEQMRTGLVYLDIFRIHARDPAELMRHLVARGMSHLHTSQWSSQKAGVAILCSLAQTWFGVEALKQAIPEVAKMILLPRIQNSNGQPAVTIPQTGQRTPSSLFGPALVLHVLAENAMLCEEIRKTEQYGRLKLLFLFGNLRGILGKETSSWRVKTPTRDDVLDVISQMIRSMDDAQGSTNLRFALPHIRHWNRMTALLRDGVVATMGTPLIVSGVAFAFVVGAVTGSLELIFRTISETATHGWRLRRQNMIIHSLRMPQIPSSFASGQQSPDTAFEDIFLEHLQYTSIREQAEQPRSEPTRHDLTAPNQDTWMVL